jgi:two-component system chemotaxis sensor kinase CheA
MDVVTDDVERIGGTIDVASMTGRGTTFTIKIPLTLCHRLRVVVEVPESASRSRRSACWSWYASAAAPARRWRHQGRAGAAPARTGCCRWLTLARVLGLEEPQGCRARPGGDIGFVVVTQVGPATFGIIVDRVHDTEEIVVKPVPPILRHIGVFSGNTILGDGSVIMILDPNGIARATGVTAEGTGSRGAEGAAGGVRSSEKTALLLFRAGDATPKAVPLGLVARLDDLPVDKIEYSGGVPVVQYRGQLMPLVPMGGAGLSEDAEARGRQTVLVFSERGRSLGLMVDAILDVVEERLEVKGGQDRPGFLGTAVVAGKVTDVIDTAWWLRQSGGDWFRGGEAAEARRLLVVEDSSFFRELVVPTLSAAGYEVVAVGAPAEALALRERGAVFDAIVSDIEMPGMDGYAFARAVREGGAWAELPMLALSGHVDAPAMAKARSAGFTDFVPKYDREALVDSLRSCLAAPISA